MSIDWFIRYCSQASREKPWARYRDRYLCPCCHMPTLTERARYEICLICFWEDDGQDSDDANEVRGGPNHDYSLSEARANFRRHQTMYRPSDHHHFKRERAARIQKMAVYFAFAEAMRRDDERLWAVALAATEAYYRQR
ncbi:hypothetical protein Fbal_1655 [Ferrimonas balearica DSM 9799]|uniref:Cysteine-rich CPCC domain-containing protein n=1 Tax=Ferrimonas balearica (strain DSM 9799 / CCM 4581 / KCTC 23876 / PAT) TaxID=550540 RepID=E1SQR1_FERBD|nr:CPCC family cysteine-rich protein [Ferrimonas balearica]ADN75859.1 hypothetical protein Fbal_1655 [Ferrimonas balearica DSM 9799]